MKSLVSASLRLIGKHSNSYLNVVVTVTVDIKLLISCTKIWKYWRHRFCLVCVFICVYVWVCLWVCVHAYFPHIPILWKNKWEDIGQFVFYFGKKWSTVGLTDSISKKKNPLLYIFNFLTWTTRASPLPSLPIISMSVLAPSPFTPLCTYIDFRKMFRLTHQHPLHPPLGLWALPRQRQGFPQSFFVFLS